MARNITSLQGGQHATNAGEQEFIQIVRLSTDTLPGTTDDNTLYMTPSTISNSVEITGAAFTSTANLANTGGPRTLRITGEEGAVASIAYSTGASGASSATLTATGTVDVSVNIAAQGVNTPQRTISATVTPGTSDPETVLAGGVNNFRSSFNQLAGRVVPAYPYTGTVPEVVSRTIRIGGSISSGSISVSAGRILAGSTVTLSGGGGVVRISNFGDQGSSVSELYENAIASLGVNPSFFGLAAGRATIRFTISHPDYVSRSFNIASITVSN